MVLRRLARPLLASIFVFGGIAALRQTEGHAEVVRPLLPEAAPVDAVTLVRVDGTVKIVAGAMLALGKAPRLAALALIGSLVPTTFAGHRFWEAKDEQEKREQLIHFLKNAGLIGGLLFAATDSDRKQDS